MVDEVQTGVAISGKMWAFEHWGLDEAPDAVIFAKKMISAGFYYKPSLIPHEVYHFIPKYYVPQCYKLQFCHGFLITLI